MATMSTNNGNGDGPTELREGAAQDQLSPVKTPHTNAVLRGPEGTDVGDLDCELSIDPEYGSFVNVSAWDLDVRQRELIAAGAHLRMTVWQHPIPPLGLAVEAPFCESCDTMTIYVKSERRFACPNCRGRVRPGEIDPKTDAERRVREDFRPAPDDESQV